MASKTGKRLRSDDHNIFLIGKVESQILGAKLPSMKQVLQVFFNQMRYNNGVLRQSARDAVKMAIAFWERARIPTQTEIKCIQKLEKLYEEWRSLQKTRNSAYESVRIKEKEFSDKIENYIFDIAASDAFEQMKIQEDKDFLIEQRKKGRPGSMAGVDDKLAQREKRTAIRLEKQHERTHKYLQSVNEPFAAGNFNDQSHLLIFFAKILMNLFCLKKNSVKFEF